MTFTAEIQDFNNDLWGHHLIVPKMEGDPFVGKNRRVICTINGHYSFQCALMPHGDGDFFINLNKEVRSKLKIGVGDKVQVSLSKDESKYGLPMPEEFEVLLQQDEEGNKWFHELTPGKQRNLIYIVGKPKNPD